MWRETYQCKNTGSNTSTTRSYNRIFQRDACRKSIDFNISLCSFGPQDLSRKAFHSWVLCGKRAKRKTNTILVTQLTFVKVKNLPSCSNRFLSWSAGKSDCELSSIWKCTFHLSTVFVAFHSIFIKHQLHLSHRCSCKGLQGKNAKTISTSYSKRMKSL